MNAFLSKWISDPGLLPRAADQDAVRLAAERWTEAGDGTGDPDDAEFARRLLEDPAGGALLDAIFGNSPFLSQSMSSEFAFARVVLERGPDAAFARVLAELARTRQDQADLTGVMREMRIAKRRCSLVVGLADIAGAWPLDRVCGALSQFADATLSVAAAHLLTSAAAAGEFTLANDDDPERDSGLIVLGMGKLGARELNYSSDIDLIVLFDLDRIAYTGRTSPQQCFVRLTRNLVKIMDERTADGYVFRTDLRLRPDPASTPLALSALAAEIYYETTGQNWERAAMIKARPVAGDLEAGRSFLETLRPFIWRKNLDFAAIQDIHSIKRQINAHRGGAEIAVAGHNVKLGRGGIREIEFFAQTQQLIWGGRDPALRVRGTCQALHALARSGRLDPAVAARLETAYGFLRRLEHRLQMVDDRQIHELPEADDRLEAIGVFMGFDDRATFADALIDELKAVEQHYAVLFEESPDLSGPGNLVFTGADDDPETLETLRRLGYRDPSVVSARIRGWHHGRYNATRSARARELLTELAPAVLDALARTVQPDTAFIKFDDFLRALPAGVQLLSLFASNPGLLDLVAEVMGSAPRLADWLSRNPALLDGVLTQGFLDMPPALEDLETELAEALNEARDYQDTLDVVRRWTNDRVFQLGARMLHGATDPEEAGAPLSNIADAGLRALLPAVRRAFHQQHGEVPGGGFAVIGLGKLGGREMTVESDLDLTFVYDAPDRASDGLKPLTPGLFYTRLSQRLIGAITAPTGEGKLFEVDMRLRPSGNAGPIATSLEGFLKYQRENAWTWEHMALTRARVIAAEDGLARRIETAIRDVLTRERDAAKLVADVADMRGRIAREHRSDDQWAIKHYRGGLVDIEFIAQYLQLRHAASHPEVLAANTTDALSQLADARVLDRRVADELIGAMHLWRKVQGVLRLSFGAEFDEARAPEGARAVLARAAGAGDFVELKERIVTTAAGVHRHFADLIEKPGAASPDES